METQKFSLWEFKKYQEHQWFKFQVLLLVGIAAIYLLIHLFFDNYKKTGSNYEIAVLTSDQVRHLDQIIHSYNNIEGDKDIEQMRKLLDTAQVAKFNEIVEARVLNREAHKDVSQRMIAYLSHEFNDKWSESQKDSIAQYVSKSPLQESKLFLEKTRYKIESNFWLIGPAVYWEIVFLVLVRRNL